MAWIMNYLSITLLLNALAVRESAGNCPRDIVIPHGYYNVTANGYILLFGCDKGYFLYGLKVAVCFDRMWSNPPPKCLANSCPKVESAGTFRVEATSEGSQLLFSCAAGFELTGNYSIHCNGSHWSAPIPKCVQKKGNLSCDFEMKDLCGWSHDPDGDFDWTWETGTTPTQGTGPSYDHTLGPNGTGHYLFMETSAPNRYGYEAILKSPFYIADESGQCFSFWYHSYGSGALSKLEVFVWKEDERKEDLTPRFTLDYVTGREWQQKTIHIPMLNESFKIIFVGTRLKGHKHDIAIDDVSLGPCPENLTSSTVPIITTTELTTTINPLTTVAEVTAKQTSSATRKSVTSQILNSKSLSSIAKPTSEDISSQKSTPSVFNVHDVKLGLNTRSPATADKRGVKNSVDNGKIDMIAVYITIGVGVMVAVIVSVATVYYLHNRRRNAKYTEEEMGPLHNQMCNADVDNEAE
ncbi:hypothetical protein ACJMK2_019962 [Sinanodonta woodiana]|uniref:Uncharacterized protein n=1 Tax=Sinanodonta woodiana TaxID=1069815 RepID=A0ABD3TXW2_SINWO